MNALRNRQKLGKEERQKQRCLLFKALRANEARLAPSEARDLRKGGNFWK